MSFIPDACDTQVPSEAQIEAAWRAFENCPIDLVGDSDEEQKKCVIAAVKAALASPVETLDFETALRQALDDLTVEDGKCNWAEVANILPRMRGELRAYTPQRLSAETAIAALAKRFWSIHPKEIQDLGITREQFYEREMLALFATHHMTYEQLEYVARAIFCADGGWLREWLAIDQDHRNYYMRLAKAAADLRLKLESAAEDNASGVHYTDYEGKVVPVEQGRVMHGTVCAPRGNYED